MTNIYIIAITGDNNKCDTILPSLKSIWDNYIYGITIFCDETSPLPRKLIEFVNESPLIRLSYDKDNMYSCIANDSQISHVLHLEENYLLTNNDTINHLLNQKFDIICPMLRCRNTQWSNFWGALNEDGFYARSRDYGDIIDGSYRDNFKVPYITGCHLTSYKVYQDLFINDWSHQTQSSKLDHDMLWCKIVRDSQYEMTVNNELNYGYIVDPEHDEVMLDIEEINNKMWKGIFMTEIVYKENFEDNINEIAPDVYYIGAFTEQFCNTIMNRDTGELVNIHWVMEYIYETYIASIIKYCYDCDDELYNSMAIEHIVLKPDDPNFEQLPVYSRTTTINILIALNDNYEGGTINFPRHNYDLAGMAIGSLVVFPSKLTHPYKFLPVESGEQHWLSFTPGY